MTMLSMSRTVRSASVAAAGLVAVGALAAVSGAGQTRAHAPVLRTDTIARVARARIPSVVFLHTLHQSTSDPRLFRSPNAAQEGLGSGVVIDASGLILTNAHVIDTADTVHVRTPEGKDGGATIVGIDPDLDLALLRAHNLTGLRPAPLGDSDRVDVGDWVVAIGNPFGLHHTVTAGIISAKARDVDDSGLELLQTDAAINPGSSGGALFDLNGALVGITTAILSEAGANIGLNFAIPINAVKQVLSELRTGTVSRGWIGMRTVRVRRTGAPVQGIELGLLVIGVADDGPAARVGIRLGDVLTRIGDSPIKAPSDLQRRLRASALGTTLPITVWRDEHQVDVRVEIEARPRPK